MEFIKAAGMAILAGWIIGVVFAWLKLPAPVPPLLGLSDRLLLVYCHNNLCTPTKLAVDC
jgi:XapX domain-containing protein